MTNLKHKLAQLISELSNVNGEIMTAAEEHLNDEDLVIFASSLQDAADKISIASEFVKDKTLSEADIEELGALAQALDESGDESLQKQASVLDEILHSIGADPKAQVAFKKAENSEIERLRAKYRSERREEAYTTAKKQQDEQNNVAQAEKDIEKKVKTYRPLEASLSTRYSPDMPGVSMIRIGDDVYQCPVTKKIYDFASGYTTAKGNKVPGTDVQGQTNFSQQVAQEHMAFSNREEILNGS